MGLPKTTLNPPQHPGNLTDKRDAHLADQLMEKARTDTDIVLTELETQLDGLSEAVVSSRLKQSGPNEIAREKRQSPLMRLLVNIKYQLVILFTALGVLSFLTADRPAEPSEPFHSPQPVTAEGGPPASTKP